jgi:DNA-binding beta-propeller fold protein YncE
MINQLDGITLDKDGYCYVSSWADDAVYKFDPGFIEEPEVFSNGHFGPADIFYSSDFNLIAIPNFKSNAIDLIEFSDKSIEGEMNPYEIKVFPNPTTGDFYISYNLSKSEQIQILFVNKSGLILSEQKGENDKIGTHKMSFEASAIGLSKGVFFIKMIIGENIFMKRLAILE